MGTATLVHSEGVGTIENVNPFTVRVSDADDAVEGEQLVFNDLPDRRPEEPSRARNECPLLLNLGLLQRSTATEDVGHCRQRFVLRPRD